ncbi:hypothetical protein ACFPES_26195 [Paenibacillus sp. GCM10023248]|uniref:hypothetical protein n=1 Tax=unclassified Paenibacillus TaxID=185978 RepID=UPI00237931E1|nr:hypothetical protein [Paenibacillus sp. MAHUQ-63]MDD9270550.1 hypothetical protein [Paenibacillus sp. MAHUQ-63]
MFRGMLRWTGAILLTASLAGCAMNAGDKNPPDNSNAQYKAQQYKKDGYMGLTSVNPNNPLNPTYHHYEDDSNLMKAVLAQFPEIEKSNIAMNGTTVRVKVKPKAYLTPAQVEELRSLVQNALDTNMPRYDIVVKMTP